MGRSSADRHQTAKGGGAPALPTASTDLLMNGDQADCHQPEGPGHWKQIPELPTKDEVLRAHDECEELPKNRIDSVWDSKEAYFSTLYKILRREGVEGLRYSTQYFRYNPAMTDDKNTCVYSEVFIKGYLMTRLGPVCRIQFNTRRAGKAIKWLQSRRLTPGTIVSISTALDNFRTVCKLAVVAQRPFVGGLDQNPPEIDIFWADVEDAVVDPLEELVMVESRRGYFESVRHVLVGLQEIAGTRSILDKYIVRGSVEDGSPAYIREAPLLSMGTLFPDLLTALSGTDPKLDKATEYIKRGDHLEYHDILSGLPAYAGDVSSMDRSQLTALHRIVSKELAIVQGPPGTGKTFTSIQALRMILRNRQKTDPPILISAQTNHALDQLLAHCLDADAKILRVGGRTEHEEISKQTLYNLRKRSSYTGQDKAYRSIEAARRTNIQEIQMFAERHFSEKLADPDALLKAGIIRQAQYDSLMDDEWESANDNNPADGLGSFESWLGDQIAPAEHATYKPQSFAEIEVDDEGCIECEIDTSVDRLAEDDEDKDRLHGTWIPFGHKWTGKATCTKDEWEQAKVQLAIHDDLWNIQKYLRGPVYRLLQAALLGHLKVEFARLLRQTEGICKQLKQKKWSNDLKLIQEHAIEVVGCTTTGLTKYRDFIAPMEPRTLLVEEAAETREANITSALLPSLQQLILVGDHQQLTPRCDIPQLGIAPYYLNVSMFERLVGLGLPYTMLNCQRRMKPELREILNQFYPDLGDHPDVALESHRPSVPGMGSNNCWLFHHYWPESSDSEMSKHNKHEAEMIAKFAAYLMQNGVPSWKITILTFYNGQRKTILRALRNEPSICNGGDQAYNVHTVDSYQGEENDIILLSLVRSPAEGQRLSAGFLENQNRVVVAVSRARCGFYVFGNMYNFLLASDRSRELWAKIWNAFAQQGRVRTEEGLPVRCQRHGEIKWFKEPDDFVGNAGGCSIKCGEKRPCGHDCRLSCHPAEHSDLPCLEACHHTLFCGHRCAANCGERCRCDCSHFQVWFARQQSTAMTQSPAHQHAKNGGIVVHPQQVLAARLAALKIQSADTSSRSGPGYSSSSALVHNGGDSGHRGNGTSTAAWQEFSRKAAAQISPTGTPQKSSPSNSVHQDTPSKGKGKQPIIKETFKEASMSNKSGRRGPTVRVNKVVHLAGQNGGGGAVGSTWLDGATSDHHYQDVTNSSSSSISARSGPSNGSNGNAAGYVSTRVAGVHQGGDVAEYGVSGFGFEAEVLGIEQGARVTVQTGHQATVGREPVAKNKRDDDGGDDDLLIHF